MLEVRKKLRHLYYAYIKAYFVYKETSKWNILDNWETLDYLHKHHCSISRYGDGEFGIIWGWGNGFQQYDEKLASRLQEVLSATDAPNHMNAIPYPLKNWKGLYKPRNFWPGFAAFYINRLRPLIDPSRTYLNTQVTRFYFEHEDKSHCAEHLQRLRSLWDGRKIVIVEGSQTRSGVGNDLYDNAVSVKRILAPAQNAFDKYEDILEAIVAQVSKDELVLMSLGMTATVLAYDLAKLGYWAIDLGHLDLEYEWFLSGKAERFAVKGKFTNEVTDGEKVAECKDEKYKNQIIRKIDEK